MLEDFTRLACFGLNVFLVRRDVPFEIIDLTDLFGEPMRLLDSMRWVPLLYLLSGEKF